ncbi:MAG: rod shape-determining protein RodA [Saprospiraceae bacterium]|nr:rod shape-determining protein RodA [Saprospiraceae bacterium]
MAQAAIKNRGMDWLMLSLYISLVTIGWLMLYSSNYDEAHPFSFLDFSTEIGKQTMWVLISALFFAATLTIEWNFWNTFAIPLYVVSLILLILVLFFGVVVKGNKSWFDLGFGSFQPSELAKFCTCLALASYMSFNKNNLRDHKVLLTAISIFALPMFLIVLQPDAGSALVFMSFFMLLYRKGLSGLIYILAFVLIGIFIFSLTFSPYFILVLSLFLSYGFLLFNHDISIKTLLVFFISLLASWAAYAYDYIPLVWIIPAVGTLIASYLSFKERQIRMMSLVLIAATLTIGLSYITQYVFDNVLKPHQQERINIWLRPEKCDPRGPLYNLIQSKLAIGSGGFAGKGFLNGEMTKLNYVPEQSTDFIFSIVGEEQGFIGSASVIVLFLLLIVRSVVIAERAKLEFIRNYAYGVAGIIFVHTFVNIGMTMGLMPIIGIPLPLISRGGTSLLIFSIMISVLIKMDASRYRS